MSAYPKPKHKFGYPTEFVGSFEQDEAMSKDGWFDTWEEANRFENRQPPPAPDLPNYPTIKYPDDKK